MESDSGRLEMREVCLRRGWRVRLLNRRATRYRLLGRLYCCLVLLAAVAVTLATAAPEPPARPVAAAAPDASAAPMGKREARVHDPSTVVKCKDEYWIFATGRGIETLHSKDLVHWEAGPRVFPEPPDWTAANVPGNRGHFWAPDVIHLGDRYLLYYSVSRWGSRTSAIGLATNATLDPGDVRYRWTDEGAVIQTSDMDNYNAIDPAVSQDGAGHLWLALGSFWSGIKLVQLDPITGKRMVPGSPIYSLAHHGTIEAACLFHHGRYYYLLVNWGLCCRGVNSTYNVRIGRSASITGPYLDRQGVDLAHGGGDLFLGTTGAFIGPGHAGILQEGRNYWLSCHFYDGTQNGAPTLAILPLAFDRNDWPIVDTSRH